MSTVITVCQGKGITPACAGRSWAGCRTNCLAGDHPRVRGEKLRRGRRRRRRGGSPPRARGEAGATNTGGAFFRITPACAGRRYFYGLQVGLSWDHPRVRGEKLHRHLSGDPSWGSPPRARGEGHAGVDTVVTYRITPACAGRSYLRKPALSSRSDHPRVRGEKLCPQVRAERTAGSPPRARGEGIENSFLYILQRITPACAGRRSNFASYCDGYRDHPRVRGEKSTGFCGAKFYLGSPPRARGEAEATAAGMEYIGITPACAGRRHPRRRQECSGQDHPRVRGEKLDRPSMMCSPPGSPPRARGEALVEDELG